MNRIITDKTQISNKSEKNKKQQNQSRNKKNDANKNGVKEMEINIIRKIEKYNKIKSREKLNKVRHHRKIIIRVEDKAIKEILKANILCLNSHYFSAKTL